MTGLVSIRRTAVRYPWRMGITILFGVYQGVTLLGSRVLYRMDELHLAIVVNDLFAYGLGVAIPMLLVMCTVGYCRLVRCLWQHGDRDHRDQLVDEVTLIALQSVVLVLLVMMFFRFMFSH